MNYTLNFSGASVFYIIYTTSPDSLIAADTKHCPLMEPPMYMFYFKVGKVQAVGLQSILFCYDFAGRI